MTEKVINVLTSTNKRNFTIVEIAKQLDKSEEEIRGAIKELQSQNKVVKSGKDKYRFNTYHPEKEEKEQIISKVCQTIKEKKFTTFHELKLVLHFNKPEQIVFLRALLKELESEKKIFHSNTRGFYSLEKVNYFSTAYLEEHIVKILQRLPYASYKRLKKELHFTKEDDETEIRKVLIELEKKGKIYSNNKMYQTMPTSYQKAIVKEVWDGGNLSAELVESGKRIKIPFANANGVLKNDTVIVSMNEEEEKCKIKKVLERQTDKIVCEVIMNEEKKELKPFRMTSTLKPRISSKDMKELVVGDLILVNVSTEETDGYYEANKIEYVGNVNDPGVDLKCIALNYGFSEEFSENALEETKQLPKEVTETELVGREDLREKIIVTIDDTTCKDMDDAISLEKLENG